MPTQEPEEITPETDEVEEYKPNRAARRAKKTAGPARATAALLRGKKPREKEIELLWPDSEDKVTLLFRSIGAKEWELLVSKHKPTPDQRADGQQFNTDTFPPALLARVCVDPSLSVEDWEEIWNSPDWSRGEVSEMYAQAVNVCSVGFDIPFSASA